MSLLELREVGYRYPRSDRWALKGVSLAVEAEAIVAVVGESGCGKTTLGKIVAGLRSPTEGTMAFEGREVSRLKGRDHKRFRRSVQIVHQDPYASLNPSLTVKDILGPALLHHGIVSRRGLEEELLRLLGAAGLDASGDLLRRFPHQLSGGQRQRVAIARAVSLRPSLVVADEAVSMLDVSVRVSVLGLLLELKAQQRLSFLFVSHDLAVVRYFAEGGRTVVMFYGAVVEEGPTAEVLQAPRHPYTYLLRESLPLPDPRLARARPPLSETFRSLEAGGSEEGCPFSKRCPWAEARCLTERPGLSEVGPGRKVACFFPGRVPQPSENEGGDHGTGGSETALSDRIGAHGAGLFE